MDKKAIEEYSEAVRTALKALTLSQRMAMHDERVGDYPSDGKTLIESLDEVICDNAACGSEVALSELYDLIEMLAHKPPKKRYTCPCCGTDNVWIAVRVNANTGYTDEDSEDPAGCWDWEKGGDGCIDVSRVADLVVES